MRASLSWSWRAAIHSRQLSTGRLLKSSMGVAESTPSNVDEVVNLYDGDPTYPWLPIIEYVADRLPNNLVRTYDFEAIREIVLEISNIPFDIGMATSKMVPKELDFEEIEFASALLVKDKNLKRMRYAYVPALIGEDVFWTLYFNRLYSRIRQYLTRNTDPGDHSDRPNATERGFFFPEIMSLKHEKLRHVAAIVFSPTLVLDFVSQETQGGKNRVFSKYYNTVEKRKILLWLRAIDKNRVKVEILDKWFAKNKTTYRLGDYCATCYEFFLRAYFGDIFEEKGMEGNDLNVGKRSYKSMAFSTPVRGDPKHGSKSTIGEFDVLLLSEDGSQLHHEELSIKYMMLHPTLHNGASGQSDNDQSGNDHSFRSFIGPHKSETLEDKVNKMQRQSQLSMHPLGKGAIKGVFESFQFAKDNSNVDMACILKGWLFYPLKMLHSNLGHDNPKGSSISDINASLEMTDIAVEKNLGLESMRTANYISEDKTINLHLNECHWYGWYTDSIEDLKTGFFQNKSHRWVILPKLLWGAPLRVDGRPPVPDRNERSKSKLLFVPNETSETRHGNAAQVDSSSTKVDLLSDHDFYENIRNLQQKSLEQNKERAGRILVAEVRWDPYVRAWLEMSRGFILEKGWGKIEGGGDS